MTFRMIKTRIHLQFNSSDCDIPPFSNARPLFVCLFGQSSSHLSGQCREKGLWTWVTFASVLHTVLPFFSLSFSSFSLHKPTRLQTNSAQASKPTNSTLITALPQWYDANPSMEPMIALSTVFMHPAVKNDALLLGKKETSKATYHLSQPRRY